MTIYLIGMMGSGKSTIGKRLSQELDFAWVDTDQLIEEELNLPIASIIETYGMEQFRMYEKNNLQLINEHNIVVSCGGGIVLDPDNQALMNTRGVAIYLKASLSTLYNRLIQSDLTNRPLLTGDVKERLIEIEDVRKELYEASADYIIEIDNLSDIEIVDLIIKWLEETNRLQGEEEA